VDESSDESSSSDSDASSGADSDFDADRKGKARACGHNHGRRGRKGDKHVNDGDKQKRRPSPNAYEKVPKTRPKDTSHEAEGSKGRLG
jgi:protein phosphatase 1 regulatory subunit 11